MTPELPKPWIAEVNEGPYLLHLTGFSPADVAANGEGRLSPSQSGQANRALAGPVFGFLFACVWMALAIHDADGIRIVAGLAMLCYCTYALIRDWLALRQGTLLHVIGDAWVEVVHDSDGPDAHFIHIASLRLATTLQVYNALRPGGPYRIFYLAEASRAVGGMALPEWREIPRPPEEKKRSRFPFNIELG